MLNLLKHVCFPSMHARQAIAVGGLVLTMKLALKFLDPYREQREAAKKRAAFLHKSLGRRLDLNEYEQLLAAHVVNPNVRDERTRVGLLMASCSSCHTQQSGVLPVSPALS